MKNRIMEGLAERMKGRCCEVLKGQWDRLIRELGVKDEALKRWPVEYGRMFAFITPEGKLGRYRDAPEGYTLISFDGFLARLLGPSFAPSENLASPAPEIGRDTSIHTVKVEGHDTYGTSIQKALDMLEANEEWVPKAGEMVEVSDDGDFWQPLEYIDKRNNYYVCWNGGLYPQTTCFWEHCRPITPTITRAEAEAKLKELGITVKIID